MATVKKTSGAPLTKWRVALYVGILFLLILLAALAYNYAFLKGQLNVGTAYGARVACSCHYLGGREIEDCQKDFEPGMEVIGLTVDDERKRVTASALLIESATAEFREGWGCVMLTDAQLADE
ncbi:MAG: hypothetical protein GW808_02790 [Sphingomonadales bacterium]|nr:hypothetical protein [Sphingomonadales bacterium]PIX66691.1 MAG: hypothetical protein COZ43_05350 [Sphingomonadales bacterium CG_4_10_14_3_um_filter_58_15]NCO48511.1 hypothetical protein [Sphingomonadales bacterium]NCO99327.1 hypothetical protein [Sphingomonadales bacterium]NCP27886.1 hypothetical protein [Sphingomonadales bacterium]